MLFFLFQHFLGIIVTRYQDLESLIGEVAAILVSASSLSYTEWCFIAIHAFLKWGNYLSRWGINSRKEIKEQPGESNYGGHRDRRLLAENI